MFNLKTQVMKKLITIVAALLLSVDFLNAQTSDVYVIDQTTCDTIKSDAQTLYFDGGFTLNMAGRGRKACVDKFGTWTVGINFKNNAAYSITIPTGMKVYRIEICGLSQGDNWEYLAAWGVGDNMLDGVGYEFVDPIGKGVKDNATIKTAKYPIDPCSGDAVYLSDKTDPSVPFAILDFGNEVFELPDIHLVLLHELRYQAQVGIVVVAGHHLRNRVSTVLPLGGFHLVTERVGHGLPLQEILLFQELDQCGHRVVMGLGVRDIGHKVPDEHAAVCPENIHEPLFLFREFLFHVSNGSGAKIQRFFETAKHRRHK